MSELEQDQLKLLQTAKNQIIIVFTGAVLIGLWMNFKFMTSIELVMENFKQNTEMRFNGVEKRIDKVEDKTDEIRRATVPQEKQVQEDRKKDPNF